MRLLLDTHIFIWACRDPDRLTAASRNAIIDPSNVVVISAVSAWEISIKHALGRIDFPIGRFSRLGADMGFDILAISVPHSIEAGSLPRYHADPFDRILIAQARVEGLTLITADRNMQQYDVPIFG